MRGHIVGSFSGMPEAFIVFGNEALEEIAHVEGNVGVGILLNHERARCVLDESGQQPVCDTLAREPVVDLIGERVESFPARRDSQGCALDQFPV